MPRPATRTGTDDGNALRSGWTAAIAAISTILLAAGCGSSGGSSAAGDVSGPQVVISGRMTFASVKPAAGSGLNYAGVVNRPIRGAVVRVLNTAGTVLSTSTTNANGAYAVSAPANATVRIEVLAALGSASSFTVEVFDNGTGLTHRATTADIATGAANLANVDLNAGTGIDAGSRRPIAGQQRLAAPFAVLDTIATCRDALIAADPTLAFPSLCAEWSPDNQGATSAFRRDGGQALIRVLGKLDDNTDEYDAHVVAREFCRFFLRTFSRSDSLGGLHAVSATAAAGNDFLDDTVAYEEGLVNALAGFLLGDARFLDSRGVGQGQIGQDLDLEGDTFGAGVTDARLQPSDVLTRRLDGLWSELAVQEIIFDVLDSAADGSDTISVGLGTFVGVLRNAQRTSKAFTSVVSLLFNLRQAVGVGGAVSAGINNIATAQNIPLLADDEFQVNNSNDCERRYTELNVAGDNEDDTAVDVDGDLLRTYSTYGSQSNSAQSGVIGGNKVFNRMLFRVRGFTGVGNLEVTINPVAIGTPMRVMVPGSDTVNVSSGAFTVVIPAAGGTQAFSVGSTVNDTAFTVSVVFEPTGPG